MVTIDEALLKGRLVSQAIEGNISIEKIVDILKEQGWQGKSDVQETLGELRVELSEKSTQLSNVLSRSALLEARDEEKQKAIEGLEAKLATANSLKRMAQDAAAEEKSMTTSKKAEISRLNDLLYVADNKIQALTDSAKTASGEITRLLDMVKDYESGVIKPPKQGMMARWTKMWSKL